MILLMVLLGALFAYIPGVLADSFLPLPSTTDLDIPVPEGDTAAERFESILGPIARSVRIIVGAVAALMIIISGFSMVIGGEKEETVTTQKKAITYGVIGLIMISIAGPIAEVFDFRAGNFLAEDELLIERTELFGDATRLVVTFIKYFLGSLAALMFIRSGATLVMQGGNEEDVTREKKNLVYAIGGLFMVILSDLLVRRVLYSARFNTERSETVIAIDESEFVSQLVAITNIIVGFVGPIMVLMLVVGGVLYVTAGGDEEKTNKAKKIIINSIIGVAIIYGAFALVSTVISGIF